MASADFADRLNEAIDLARNGQTIEARALLRELLRDNPNLELAWMWLATVAETPQERIEALQNTVRINPANEKARAALQALGSRDPLDTVPPPLLPADLAPDDRPPSRSFPINALLIGLIVLILVGGLVLLGTAVGRALYRPTLTPSSTATRMPTLARSLTPSETPGGPSDTPVVIGTAPPTWTAAPSSTAPATSTLLPSFSPVPTLTLINTITPFVSDTPYPSTTPYLSPTISPTASETSDVTPTDTPDGTPAPTSSPTTHFSLPGGDYIGPTTVAPKPPTPAR